MLALNGYGGIFRRQVDASGVIPQISVILGPCAGGAAYSPALADFTFMVRDTARMYLTGPDVVEAVSGQRVTHEELGGADVHGERSGVATVVHDDEETCLDDVRYLVSLLPSNYLEPPPATPTGDAATTTAPRLADIVPVEPNQPYDMRDVVRRARRRRRVLRAARGLGATTCCARWRGSTAGSSAWSATSRRCSPGCSTGRASQKAARFVRFCDAFGIPLVSLVDVPGFLPGVEQERGGIIRQGAQLLHAYCEATVPRIQVILRKAYGGAYIVMDSRSIGCDLSLAWPTNQIAVMGAEGAVNVLYRRDLAARPTRRGAGAELVAEYTEEFLNPQYAAERGLVDDIIDPAETRAAVARGLAMLRDKRKPRARPQTRQPADLRTERVHRPARHCGSSAASRTTRSSPPCWSCSARWQAARYRSLPRRVGLTRPGAPARPAGAVRRRGGSPACRVRGSRDASALPGHPPSGRACRCRVPILWGRCAGPRVGKPRGAAVLVRHASLRSSRGARGALLLARPRLWCRRVLEIIFTSKPSTATSHSSSSTSSYGSRRSVISSSPV